MRGVNGVDEISSTVSEGSSQTFVQFQLGTPTDRAVNDVRNAIPQIRGNLPEGILEPQVTASMPRTSRSATSAPQRRT